MDKSTTHPTNIMLGDLYWDMLNLIMREFQISNGRPIVSFFIHVMLEHSLHSRMWLLRKCTFNPRCPQTKARSLLLFIGRFQLVNFNFLFSKNSLNWCVFCLIHSPKSSHFYFCGQLHFLTRTKFTMQFPIFWAVQICRHLRISCQNRIWTHVFTFTVFYLHHGNCCICNQ